MMALSMSLNKKAQALSITRALGLLKFKSLATFNCIGLKDCSPFYQNLFYWAYHSIKSHNVSSAKQTSNKQQGARSKEQGARSKEQGGRFVKS